MILSSSGAMHSDSIAQVSTEGTPAWVRFFGEPGTRVTEDGDLVIDIRDSTQNDAGADALVLWAAARSFSLEGIDLRTAVFSLYFATLYKALAEVTNDSPLMPAVSATYAGEDTGLDFRVLVNGDYIIKKLVADFDGPFEPDREDYYKAISWRRGLLGDEGKPVRLLQPGGGASGSAEGPRGAATDEGTGRAEASASGAWSRVYGDPSTRITEREDIVLDLNDLVDDAPAIAALMEWADRRNFSLDGIDLEVAVKVLCYHSVHEAVREVSKDSPMVPDIEAVYSGQATELDFRVCLDGHLAVLCLTVAFDGPFTEKAHLTAAIEQRLGAPWPPLTWAQDVAF